MSRREERFKRGESRRSLKGRRGGKDLRSGRKGRGLKVWKGKEVLNLE